jgi:magnesium chelatase family protein
MFANSRRFNRFSDPRPGEVSLAHHGVLFLDELPEFERKVLEVLREPLESRVINISRASRQACFPADFQLVAAMNPCPCGYLGHASGRCQCTPEQIARYAGNYQARCWTGLICMYRFQPYGSRVGHGVAREGSQQIRLRVQQARDRQLQRQGCCNARLSGAELEQHAAADQTSLVLGDALDRLGLSARSYHRILRIARTIADMDGEHRLSRQHILQAIQLRRSGLAL